MRCPSIPDGVLTCLLGLACTCSRPPQGRVLYVGKATRLSERVRAYFATTPDRAMIPELVSRADDIECIVTPTPQEALGP